MEYGVFSEKNEIINGFIKGRFYTSKRIPEDKDFRVKIKKEEEREKSLLFSFSVDLIKDEENTEINIYEDTKFLPKSQMKIITKNDQEFYLIPNWLAEKNEIHIFCDFELGSTLAKEQDKIDIKNLQNLPKFENFEKYLKALNSEKLLMDEKQLQALEINIELSKEKVAAYRKKGVDYVELYDVGDIYKFISSDEKFIGTEEEVKNFGLDLSLVKPLGVTISYGQFYKVYDLNKIVEQLGLKKHNGKLFPCMNYNESIDKEFVKELIPFISAYSGHKFLKPVYDMEQYAKSKKMKLFEKFPDFPYCISWKLERFGLKSDFKLKPDGIVLDSSSKCTFVYNSERILKSLTGELDKKDIEKEDCVVPFNKFADFEDDCYPSYHQHLTFKGLYKKNYVFQGPNTKKWNNMIEKYNVLK